MTYEEAPIANPPPTKMLPFARRDLQANFVFQYDNAQAHRARRVMDFLEDENVQHMDWPAMSRTSGRNLRWTKQQG